MAIPRASGFCFRKLVHSRLPCPLRHFRISRREVCPSNLKIQDWLAEGLVFDVEEGSGLSLAFGAKADLFSRYRVLAVVNVSAPKQDEP